MRHVMAVVLCAVSMAGCAHVQATQSWSELTQHGLPVGEPVAVSTLYQGEVRGNVSAVSSDSVTLIVDGRLRRFDARDVRQVRRDGDSLWNGFAIGAGVGVLGAALPDDKCTGQPPTCDRQIPHRVAFMAAAIAAGVGIDALHRDRTVLYRSPTQLTVRLVPMVTAERKSISITISGR